MRVTAEHLVENFLTDCIRALQTFDGMTLRNSLVIAAAFRAAYQLGFHDVWVGDAADELLGGYSFMWGKDEDDPKAWKEKRDSMCQTWTFATKELAQLYGVASHAPFMDPDLVDWVLEHIQRSDCIGNRPIQLVYGGQAVEHMTGKMLLRQAYETVASWRRKDPIEVGSGITIIGKDEYWKGAISDDEFQTQVERLREQGFVIHHKEYLTNFRIFQKCFGDNGENHPTKRRLALGEGCVGCCYEIADQTFCRICGAYPAQRESPLA
jgi:asparagine synthase (glutamine-hydrolysing)